LEKSTSYEFSGLEPFQTESSGNCLAKQTRKGKFRWTGHTLRKNDEQPSKVSEILKEREQRVDQETAGRDPL
jgi:hypothetical protein